MPHPCTRRSHRRVQGMRRPASAVPLVPQSRLCAVRVGSYAGMVAASGGAAVAGAVLPSGVHITVGAPVSGQEPSKGAAFGAVSCSIRVTVGIVRRQASPGRSRWRFGCAAHMESHFGVASACSHARARRRDDIREPMVDGFEAKKAIPRPGTCTRKEVLARIHAHGAASVANRTVSRLASEEAVGGGLQSNYPRS
jgi:hypothetical protein